MRLQKQRQSHANTTPENANELVSCDRATDCRFAKNMVVPCLYLRNVMRAVEGVKVKKGVCALTLEDKRSRTGFIEGNSGGSGRVRSRKNRR